MSHYDTETARALRDNAKGSEEQELTQLHLDCILLDLSSEEGEARATTCRAQSPSAWNKRECCSFHTLQRLALQNVQQRAVAKQRAATPGAPLSDEWFRAQEKQAASRRGEETPA